ncbi:hypothetical protein MKW92_046584 [Papaver armeniacum]|nr:hypothetical protein MKW92_046584 [Papaver armeniacum]
MAHSLGLEVEVKCSANVFYGFFKNNITELKNHFPEIYESVHVIEGHGPSVGSVRLWKYKLDGQFVTAKERMIAVNNEGKSITWSLEGDKINFEIKLVSVTPTGEGFCLVKWLVTLENANRDVEFLTAFINYLRTITVGLPSRLLKQV